MRVFLIASLRGVVNSQRYFRSHKEKLIVMGVFTLEIECSLEVTHSTSAERCSSSPVWHRAADMRAGGRGMAGSGVIGRRAEGAGQRRSSRASEVAGSPSAASSLEVLSKGGE